MALTAIVQRDIRGKSIQSFRIANTEQIFLGGYVALNASGDAINVADTASFEPLGFAVGFSELDVNEDTGDTSATPAPEVQVAIEGGIIRKLAVTGVTAETDKGALVYATDENTFTLTPTSNIPAVGAVARFQSTAVADVLFFDFEQMRGN